MQPSTSPDVVLVVRTPVTGAGAAVQPTPLTVRLVIPLFVLHQPAAQGVAACVPACLSVEARPALGRAGGLEQQAAAPVLCTVLWSLSANKKYVCALGSSAACACSPNLPPFLCGAHWQAQVPSEQQPQGMRRAVDSALDLSSLQDSKDGVPELATGARGRPRPADLLQ